MPYFALQLLEEMGDLVVAGDVALKAFGARQGGDEVVGFLLKALVLVGDREAGSSLLHLLGDGPRDAALVGHSKYHNCASVHATCHASEVLRWCR